MVIWPQCLWNTTRTDNVYYSSSITRVEEFCVSVWCDRFDIGRRTSPTCIFVQPGPGVTRLTVGSREFESKLIELSNFIGFACSGEYSNACDSRNKRWFESAKLKCQPPRRAEPSSSSKLDEMQTMGFGGCEIIPSIFMWTVKIVGKHFPSLSPFSGQCERYYEKVWRYTTTANETRCECEHHR